MMKSQAATAPDFAMPVLIVDDYAAMLRVLRSILATIGFTDIDVAKDGATALDMLRRRTYGLVISDWHMAQMSGHDLLREMKADAELAATPFIMIGAEPNFQHLVAARQAGANAFLIKPFSAALLREKILDAFGATRGAA